MPEDRLLHCIQQKGQIVELELKQGPVFNQSEPAEVLDFLRTRRRETFAVSPESLRIAVAGKEMTLQMTGGNSGEFPLRRSFFLKLLKWYSFPASAAARLNGETVASVMNDFLLAIKGETVNVTIEDGEALTITSSRYSELSDLTVIQASHRLGIKTISRDDFVTRIYSADRAKKEPVKGDVCGIGFNVFNSETGFSPLSMTHFILRYICSNGAVVSMGSVRKGARIHYRIPPADLEKFLKERIDHADRTREKFIGSLQRFTEMKAQRKLRPVFDALRPIIGKPAADRLRELVSEETTMYDLFNLITDHAKNLDPLRRIRLETFAGSLLLARRTN
jgi:hypothetical protein